VNSRGISILFVSLFLLLLSQLPASASSASKNPLRVVNVFPAPESQNPNNIHAIDNFSIQLLSEAAASMGRDLIVQRGSRQDSEEWLKHGKVDVIAAVVRDSSTKANFDYTFPFLTLHGAIVVRHDESEIQSLDHLHGRKVAVLIGPPDLSYPMQLGIDILDHSIIDPGVPIEKQVEYALKELGNDNLDAVIMQRLHALEIQRQKPELGLHVLPQVIEKLQHEFCFAVRDGEKHTLALLNEGLAKVTENGTKRRLYAEWLSPLELPTRSRIVIGGDYRFPPYEFLDPLGRPTGFNVELTQAIARTVGLTVEFQLGAWHEIRNSLLTGKIDAIMGMPYSVESDAYFDFSPAHTIIQYISVVRKDNITPPSSLEDLVGMELAVMRDGAMHHYALSNGLLDELATVRSQQEALLAVAEGRRDCALVSRRSALYWINELEWDNLELGETPFLTAEYCYSVLDGEQTLFSLFGEGLQLIKESGEYHSIRQKWLGIYEEQLATKYLKFAIIIFVPLLLALLGTMLWSWMLRKQVARKTADLYQSQATLQAALQGNEFGIIIVDAPDGRVRLANKAIRDWYNRPEPESTEVTELAEEWQTWEPDGSQTPTDKGPLTRAIQQGETSRRQLIVFIDGKEHILMANSAPIRDKKGKIVAGISIQLDITELLNAQKVLREAQELRVANKMAATIAHEFNNPMAVISGTLDLISMGVTDITEQEKQFEKIRAQIQRMKNLVNYLLELRELKEIDYAASTKILDIHPPDSINNNDSSDSSLDTPDTK